MSGAGGARPAERAGGSRRAPPAHLVAPTGRGPPHHGPRRRPGRRPLGPPGRGWPRRLLGWRDAPTSGGRNVVVRLRPDGTAADVIPSPSNARTRVHEYGGADLRRRWRAPRPVRHHLYLLDQRPAPGPDARRRAPRRPPAHRGQRAPSASACATPTSSSTRPAGACSASARPPRARSALQPAPPPRPGTPSSPSTSPPCGRRGPARRGGRPQRVLVSGNDFYANPRLSPDGQFLSWLTWNHPNMPWDGTELWVGEPPRRAPSGRPARRRRAPASSSSPSATGRRASRTPSPTAADGGT